jgi:methylglutaconyl-CoA hydratase
VSAAPAPASLEIRHDGAVARVRLARPDVRNAFDEALVRSLRETFLALSSEAGVRAVVVEGLGPAFCAGGDLAWMRRKGEAPIEENVEDARGLAAAYLAVARCPKPVVAKVHGAAVGGGAGLVAACDLAVAADTATFAFPEVRLGIVPAAVSPYVVRRVGWSQARRLFLTGERFGAAEASRIGLVHEVVPEAALEDAVAAVLGNLLLAAPAALARAKRLLQGLDVLAPDGRILDLTGRALADARASAEGREGLSAFLEKRRPSWAP